MKIQILVYGGEFGKEYTIPELLLIGASNIHNFKLQKRDYRKSFDEAVEKIKIKLKTLNLTDEGINKYVQKGIDLNILTENGKRKIERFSCSLCLSLEGNLYHEYIRKNFLDQIELCFDIVPEGVKKYLKKEGITIDDFFRILEKDYELKEKFEKCYDETNQIFKDNAFFCNWKKCYLRSI